MIAYEWPGFRLEYDPATGGAYTIYPDGTRSGCEPHEDDQYHADLLGFTAAEHRLQHELAHHLVGGLFDPSPVGGCPIVYADAHGQPMPKDADVLEWRITALQYHARGRRYDEGRIGALLDIEAAGEDPYELAYQLNWMMAAVGQCTHIYLDGAE